MGCDPGKGRFYGGHARAGMMMKRRREKFDRGFRFDLVSGLPGYKKLNNVVKYEFDDVILSNICNIWIERYKYRPVSSTIPVFLMQSYIYAVRLFQ